MQNVRESEIYALSQLLLFLYGWTWAAEVSPICCMVQSSETLQHPSSQNQKTTQNQQTNKQKIKKEISGMKGCE